VVGVVPPVSDDEPEVVAALRESGGHLEVGAEPVVLGSIEVEVACGRLQEDTQWLRGASRISSG
jgi:hypothetical protein